MPLQERCPPCVDDFLYICDDAYKRDELIAMEMSILSTLKFDINIPIAYRFLRRFAKVSAFRGWAGGPPGTPSAGSMGQCLASMGLQVPSWQQGNFVQVPSRRLRGVRMVACDRLGMWDHCPVPQRQHSRWGKGAA